MNKQQKPQLDKTFKKTLRSYIYQKKKKNIPTATIKRAFIRRGYTKTQVKEVFKDYYLDRTVKIGSSIVVSLFLFILLLFQANNVDVIQAVSVEKMHIQNLNQIIDQNTELEWIPENEGSLLSFELEGRVPKTSDVTIYLVSKEDQFVVFKQKSEDKESTETPTPQIEERVIENTENNETTQTTNETESTIKTTLEYVNSNGEVPSTESMSFTVKNSNIPEAISQEKMCTVWIVESETEQAEAICNGNTECCSFTDLDKNRETWNEQFDVTLGMHGATETNKVTAQILYVDYNLSIENPYSNTIISEEQSLPATFYSQYNNFEFSCIESCNLNGLNDTTYTISIETNDTITVNTIRYSIQTDVIENNAPLILKNFTDITTTQGNSIAINLSNHFLDPDNDTLEYTYYNSSGLSVAVQDNIATINTNSFTGTEYMFFIASDLRETATSNIFSIKVEEQQTTFQVQEGLKSLRQLISG